jgi:hypothetical protein
VEGLNRQNFSDFLPAKQFCCRPRPAAYHLRWWGWAEEEQDEFMALVCLVLETHLTMVLDM